jgi:phosphatidylserine/phosphatidylglycerophosphate/cardiolipin synthase-like enzyme
VERVHSKIIAIDNKKIIIGSFNWLSASRENSSYIRDETSLIYRGHQVSRIIETIIKPIKNKVKARVEAFS